MPPEPPNDAPQGSTPSKARYPSPQIGCLSVLGLGIVGLFLFPPYFCIDMCPHHKNSEATQWLGTLSRAQESYFLDHSRFTASMEDLEIGMEPETEFYSYKIFNNSPTATYAYARSKDGGLYSYISAAFITTNTQGEKITTSIVCGVNQPKLVETALPRLQGQQPVCAPQGSWKLGEKSTSAKYQQYLWRWWLPAAFR